LVDDVVEATDELTMVLNVSFLLTLDQLQTWPLAYVTN